MGESVPPTSVSPDQLFPVGSVVVRITLLTDSKMYITPPVPWAWAAPVVPHSPRVNVRVVVPAFTAVILRTSSSSLIYCPTTNAETSPPTTCFDESLNSMFWKVSPEWTHRVRQAPTRMSVLAAFFETTMYLNPGVVNAGSVKVDEDRPAWTYSAGNLVAKSFTPFCPAAFGVTSHHVGK